MSKFYFGSGSGDASSDDEDNLPYPEALPRGDFLAPDFDASAYLSTLSDRHQTLEDLRADLRERSQALSKELLDLVNTNYEQFLSLGSDLKGGEEKVEDVRVGLLGFKRGVEDVRGKVRERKLEVDVLLAQKKDASRQIALGRRLLEIDARLEELEDRLMVASLGRGANLADEEAWSESEDDEKESHQIEILAGGTSTKKLQRLVADYQQIGILSTSIGKNHPFIATQQPRLLRIRNTLLLDLNAALKHLASLGEDGKTGLIKVLNVYQDLGAQEDAVKVLKDLRARQ